jgi:hypothetical protein
MGATKVCPGTHMCANNKGRMCERHGITPVLPPPPQQQQQNGSNSEMWRTGDGVLFNQQLCHRGERHVHGPERVMLVVSFASRPKSVSDSRVLASGLYCFSLWTTWGLTWQDLYDPSDAYMTSWWSRSLLSLGIWKPSIRNWRIDFVTKSIMEWNLGENGMEPHELTGYTKTIQHKLGFPDLLHGEIIEIAQGTGRSEVAEDVYHSKHAQKADECLWRTFRCCYSFPCCRAQRNRPHQ